MDWLKMYVLRLIAAAIVCSVIIHLFGKKGTFGALLKFLAGIYLTLNIVSPWVQIRMGELTDMISGFSTAAEAAGEEGQKAAREAMAESITKNTSAYILDKASSLDAELTVEVLLDESDIPAPCRVYIRGNISPYGKRILSSMIETDLGIPLEDQIWT